MDGGSIKVMVKKKKSRILWLIGIVAVLFAFFGLFGLYRGKNEVPKDFRGGVLVHERYLIYTNGQKC